METAGIVAVDTAAVSIEVVDTAADGIAVVDVLHGSSGVDDGHADEACVSDEGGRNEGAQVVR